MTIMGGIMRSGLLDRDFDLLLKSRALYSVIDDGFATDGDMRQGLFPQNKAQLALRYQDFKDCMDFFDRSYLRHRKGVNRRWGTTARLKSMVEKRLGRPISHGALLLALDLRGVGLEQIEGQRDAYMCISDRSRFS